MDFKKNRKLIFLEIVSVFIGALILFAEFWIAFGIILYFVLFLYFSGYLKNVTNIHAVTLTFIFVYAVPASISILRGETVLSGSEITRLYSSISVGLLGYAAGALLFKKIFSSPNRRPSELSQKINGLFWLAYEYRVALAFLSGLMILFLGFMPLSMSYTESVAYRMNTPGAVQYLSSLLSLVFSVMGVAMISIVGDISRRGKLSWISYFLIALAILSIIAGNRIWIVGLAGCLMIAFQPRLSRKKMVALALISMVSFFVFSGAVRYARRGVTFEQNIKNFQTYVFNLKNMNLGEMAWGFSDLTVPFSTFVAIVKNVPENIGYDRLVPLNDMSLLVPTVFYPGRPLSYSQWYVKNFEPEIYAIGGGRTFYIIAIGYLFAGAAGVFIYMFLFGVLLEGINKFFKAVGGAAGIFMYSYFFMALVSLARSSGLVGFIKTGVVLYFLIPLILLFSFVFVLDSLVPKKKAKRQLI